MDARESLANVATEVRNAFEEENRILSFREWLDLFLESPYQMSRLHPRFHYPQDNRDLSDPHPADLFVLVTVYHRAYAEVRKHLLEYSAVEIAVDYMDTLHALTAGIPGLS